MSEEQKESAPNATDSAVTLLSVRNLERIYRLGEQTIHALRPLTMDIHQGDFIAIAGPSGSGKSTLLQLLDWSTRRRPAKFACAIDRRSTWVANSEPHCGWARWASCSRRSICYKC